MTRARVAPIDKKSFTKTVQQIIVRKNKRFIQLGMGKKIVQQKNVRKKLLEKICSKNVGFNQLAGSHLQQKLLDENCSAKNSSKMCDSLICQGRT